MRKWISVRLVTALFLLVVTGLSGCASGMNSRWFDGGNLFSALPWSGAPGGQTEPDLVYQDVNSKQTEPE